MQGNTKKYYNFSEPGNIQANSYELIKPEIVDIYFTTPKILDDFKIAFKQIMEEPLNMEPIYDYFNKVDISLIYPVENSEPDAVYLALCIAKGE